MKTFIQASEIRCPSKGRTPLEFRGGLSKGLGMPVYSELKLDQRICGGSSAIGVSARKAGLDTLPALPGLENGRLEAVVAFCF
jgi:hypothetical protein